MTFGEMPVPYEDGMKRGRRERLLHEVPREIHSSVILKFAFWEGCQECRGETSKERV